MGAFKTKPALLAALAGGVLATLLLGGLFRQPTQAQPPAAPAVPGWRYQMVVKPGAENTAVFVIDSATGQCWSRDTNPQVKRWTDLGTPLVKEGK